MMRRAVRWMAGVAMAAALAGALPAAAMPVIQHDPVRTGVKGQALGLRVTVRDAAARVSGVSLFYATSRGMTPMRTALTGTGAGVWYGSIPGHMVGPGDTLMYYIQAENADGETAETDWINVRLSETGVAPERIPSATAAAAAAQRSAMPAAQNKPAQTAARSDVRQSQEEESPYRKYLVPGAIALGTVAVVGGAVALAGSGGGGGGGGGGSNTNNYNGTYSGNYHMSFTPSGSGGAETVPSQTEGGLASVYVEGTGVRIVGMWGGETISCTRTSRTFSGTAAVSAHGSFPAAHLVATGELEDSGGCRVTVEGYSTDAAKPGDFSGSASLARTSN